MWTKSPSKTDMTHFQGTYSMQPLLYRSNQSRWSSSIAVLGGLIIMLVSSLPLEQHLAARTIQTVSAGVEPIVVIAEADARVAVSTPSSNFGASAVLRVNGGSSTLVASYVRFTIPNLAAPIQDAVVRLYATSASADGATISAASNTWNEMQISWNLQPQHDDSVIAQSDSIIAASWIEFPVSAEVTGNGSYSFLIATTSSDGAHFSSREGEYPPQLVLTLATAPTPTASPSATPTASPSTTPTANPSATPTRRPTRTPTPIAGIQQVTASLETDPVPDPYDAADDIAIWVHPTTPSLSTIIGTNKQGGLIVYDLMGRELQTISGLYNNVDIRDDFMLGGQPIALVTTSDRKTKTIDIYRVNPTTRLLEEVSARPILTATVYGACMFHSSRSNKFYFFGTRKTDGLVEQWLLYDDGAGRVDAKLVRTFVVGSQTEGCVADDDQRKLYIGEETVGIWKYGAEPHQGDQRTLIDTTGPGGHLQADVEGLTIAYEPDGNGYLIASSQGNDTYVLYRRDSQNAYVKKFQIVASATIDGVSETDGIDVTLASLGAAFPYGVFVAQDGTNDDGYQNFKLVQWQHIMTSADSTPTPTAQP